jgi:hypothetical protein
MNQPYNRISENVLFVVLMAAVAGWVTAPAAVELQLASAAQACIAAAFDVECS